MEGTEGITLYPFCNEIAAAFQLFKFMALYENHCRQERKTLETLKTGTSYAFI